MTNAVSYTEILPPSDLPSPVNGILWEMSELVTQERIAIGSSNPPRMTTDQSQKVKVTRSRNVSAAITL